VDLDAEVNHVKTDLGIGYFGIADLSPAREAILAQGGELVAKYPFAISIGLILPHAIVDQLPNRAERVVAMNYRHHAYDVINQRLDHITSRLNDIVQRAGYRAFPIPASQIVDEELQIGLFSHKMAAHLAGLGWIGKNCLLITPENGPRVRWATILTDAPLRISGEPVLEQCGECVECVEICPVRAFTGRPFYAGEPREARFDAFKCDRYFQKLEEKDLKPGVCGMCLYICPYGRQVST